MTHDGDVHWPTFYLGAPATLLAVDPANPEIVLLGTSLPVSQGRGLLVSTNGATSFHEADLETPDIANVALWYEWSVSFDPAGTLAIVGTLAGVYAAPAKALGGPCHDVRGNAVSRVFTGVAWSGATSTPRRPVRACWRCRAPRSRQP